MAHDDAVKVKKPTIAELEEMLKRDDKVPLQFLPNGEVTLRDTSDASFRAGFVHAFAQLRAYPAEVAHVEHLADWLEQQAPAETDEQRARRLLGEWLAEEPWRRRSDADVVTLEDGSETVQVVVFWGPLSGTERKSAEGLGTTEWRAIIAAVEKARGGERG